MTATSQTTRVLLVDDDPAFIARVHEALTPITRLRTVSSGNTALSTVPVWDPDVILFDLLMEDLDGFQFLEAIAGSSIRRRPFILCTTDGRGADTRVRPLPDWYVGTLIRSSSINELRMAVLQAARCQDPNIERSIFA